MNFKQLVVALSLILPGLLPASMAQKNLGLLASALDKLSQELPEAEAFTQETPLIEEEQIIEKEPSPGEEPLGKTIPTLDIPETIEPNPADEVTLPPLSQTLETVLNAPNDTTAINNFVTQLGNDKESLTSLPMESLKNVDPTKLATSLNNLTKEQINNIANNSDKATLLINKALEPGPGNEKIATFIENHPDLKKKVEWEYINAKNTATTIINNDDKSIPLDESVMRTYIGINREGIKKELKKQLPNKPLSQKKTNLILTIAAKTRSKKLLNKLDISNASPNAIFSALFETAYSQPFKKALLEKAKPQLQAVDPTTGNTVLHNLALRIKNDYETSQARMQSVYEEAIPEILNTNLVDISTKNKMGKTAYDLLAATKTSPLQVAEITTLYKLLKMPTANEIIFQINNTSQNKQAFKAKQFVSALLDASPQELNNLPIDNLFSTSCTSIVEEFNKEKLTSPLTQQQKNLLIAIGEKSEAPEQELIKLYSTTDVKNLPLPIFVEKLIATAENSQGKKPLSMISVYDNLATLDNNNNTIFHLILKKVNKKKSIDTDYQNAIMAQFGAMTKKLPKKTVEALLTQKNKKGQDVQQLINKNSTFKTQLSRWLAFSLPPSPKTTSTTTITTTTIPTVTPEIKQIPSDNLIKIPKGETQTEAQKDFIKHQDKLYSNYVNNRIATNFWSNNVITPFKTILIQNSKTPWATTLANRTSLNNLIYNYKLTTDAEAINAFLHLAGRIDPQLISPDLLTHLTSTNSWSNNSTFTKSSLAENRNTLSDLAYFGNIKNGEEALKRGFGIVLDTAVTARKLFDYYLADMIKKSGAFALNAKQGIKEGAYADVQSIIAFFNQVELFKDKYLLKGDALDKRFVQLLEAEYLRWLGSANLNDQTKKALIDAGFDNFAAMTTQKSNWDQEAKNRRWCHGNYLVTGKNARQALRGLEPKTRFSSATFDPEKLCSPDDDTKKLLNTPYKQGMTVDLQLILCQIERYTNLKPKSTSTVDVINFEQTKQNLLIPIIKSINMVVGYLLDTIDESNRENLVGWLEDRGYHVDPTNETICDEYFNEIRSDKNKPIIITTITARVCPVCFDLDAKDDADLKKLETIEQFLNSLNVSRLKALIEKATKGILLLKIFYALDNEATIQLPAEITIGSEKTSLTEIRFTFSDFQSGQYPAYEQDLSSNNDSFTDLRKKAAHFMRQKELFPLGEAWRKM